MKKKILIVDDDIITLKILKKYLDEKYDVQTENAGYRFVDKIDSFEVDLILLDLEMPVVNGLQAFDAILKNPRLKNVPVAFLSGVSNPNLVRELIAKGAAGYIIKTTPKGELLERVEKIFSKNQVREVTPEVMILGGDISALKRMRETLAAENYLVKAVRTIVEAAQYLETHMPNLFIICKDQSGSSPTEIYDAMSDIIRNKNIRTIMMDEMLFSNELIDRVSEAFL